MIWFPSSKLTLLKQDLIHKIKITFTCTLPLHALIQRAIKNSKLHNRPFYSYVWNRGWSWPCFDTNLPALSCKSSYSYANQYFSRTISITKQRRFVSKQGHRQPHIHSKARVLSPQLKNGLFVLSEQKNAKRAHARSRMALVSGTLAPLHRLPWQQLTLHFLIVAPFGANALQSSSLPQADFALHFLA